MARNALIQVRRDTAANWTSANPTLAAGEMGFETDTGKLKIGTGSTAWTSLLYTTDASDITGATLASNVVSSSLTSFGSSPALTGTPTAVTASAGTNTTQVATTAFVTTAVSNIRVGSVPNFLVYFTGTNGSVVSGAYAGYNTELYDDTNNVVSGVFTVPSGQAGVYQFNAASSVYNIGTSGYFRIQLVTTGSTGLDVNGSQTPAQGGTDVFSVVSGTVKLAVGDTVRIRWVSPASGLYSAGITYNNFSGVRIA